MFCILIVRIHACPTSPQIGTRAPSRRAALTYRFQTSRPVTSPRSTSPQETPEIGDAAGKLRVSWRPCCRLLCLPFGKKCDMLWWIAFEGSFEIVSGAIVVTACRLPDPRQAVVIRDFLFQTVLRCGMTWGHRGRGGTLMELSRTQRTSWKESNSRSIAQPGIPSGQIVRNTASVRKSVTS